MSSNSDLSDILSNFAAVNEEFKIAQQNLESKKRINDDKKIDILVNYVATEVFLDPLHFDAIFSIFSKYIPVLLQKALFYDINDRIELKTVLLGRVVKERSDLQGFALKYFSKIPSIFSDDSENVSKKIKRDIDYNIDLLFVESCYFLLRSNPDFYRNKWNWSVFYQKYYKHSDNRVKWIFFHVFAILFGIGEYQINKIILDNIPDELHSKYKCIFSLKNTLNDDSLISISKNFISNQLTTVPNDLVNFSGIYIPIISSESNLNTGLVEVPTTSNNLRKIALGLTLNKAICLQGPVGSGKTTLVEYFAEKTGRNLGENFIKVQLGDQTDSKMLLGTYRCTDVPGEFVWQPGVLTQAVLDGNWLLLEDIDSASMDIASMLTSLLENNYLTVPGYRDSVPVAPGFQLFVTHRFLSGHHKSTSNSLQLLKKHLLQITIDPLTTNELKQITIMKYPEFETICNRLVDVFLLFNQDTTPKSGRQISTRDYFKWCARAAIDFDVKTQSSALKVLQDAIDVFCCSFHKKIDALDLAKRISSILGIIPQKSEYFINDYKPTIEVKTSTFVAGRVTINRCINELITPYRFCYTRQTSLLIERISSCIQLKEPVLLVGETGTGKTTSVQFLSQVLGHKLIVINMNQQSDSADLLGGYKPVDFKYLVAPVRREFEDIFSEYFKVEPNKKFLSNIAYCYNNQKWAYVIKMMLHSAEAALKRLKQQTESVNNKNAIYLNKWLLVTSKLKKLESQLKNSNALAFAFIEGSLVKAVEKGQWVLLDEINLANAETLECLSGLLEGTKESLCLLERGDKKPVQRHSNFTLFACMNPSTDVGKKDLPPGLRNRFTEFYVDELSDFNDLLLLVNNYLENLVGNKGELRRIVDFYLKVKSETESVLLDGVGHKPHYSLRSLCRALGIAAINPCGVFKRSLYEGFCLSFLTQLDDKSYQIVKKMIASYMIGDAKSLKAILNQPIPAPKNADNYLQFEGYWVQKGNLEPSVPDDYILTESVRKNLKDLVRVVSLGKLPVLLQGDTSVGKTSLITYLAKASGNKCVRINNHEHTDLQEYVGSYVADANGKLVFREGLLVEAMRKGHWIILDELNLAPTDVLEALNRALDDNRELFIPETQETVKADCNFMLFATQNPPGAYGGRKMLSRAFRNRFVELHFTEIPPKELEFILHQRCQMAPSYAKKMINVMTDLQMRRRGSAAFAGKQGFITLRDLFRWGERYRLAQNTKKLYDWDQHLADEGYLVLAGKVRRLEEKKEIIEVLQKHLKREVDPNKLFTLSEHTSTVTKHILLKIEENKGRYENIVWTYNMRQLAVLVSKAMEFKEPVLLVGETGGGKTTVCQLIAEINGQQLVTVNCHMHTESSDFIGSLRPVRDHLSDSKRLFEWVDGPLIESMVKGHVFLADEISLADDSVLERLNSLLEPERTLLLSEKGIDLNNRDNSELIVADSRFLFIGTMNPGGDFGKKELSPALRNRFTEIWCESCKNRQDLIDIIEQNVRNGVSMGNQQDGSTGIGVCIMDFVEWFQSLEIGKRFTISIRDILTWVHFLNVCSEKMETSEAYVHGAYLTFLDSLGSGVTSTENTKSLESFKSNCLTFLINQISHLGISKTLLNIQESIVCTEGGKFGIKPFYIETNMDGAPLTSDFSFNAPTTMYNTMRLLRGMQLNKAILLEGSPGVGKTSLVTALAKCTGNNLFRINLSDQTDISDLFGADLPAEGGVGGQFCWRDGPFLQALKKGDWILLDELNLASQSVLEGLNACLDHRGEVYIPELGKTFYLKAGTRFFGCQNPLKQGGSRRGLPKSFLNRFIQVYVNALTDKDLECILKSQFTLPDDLLGKMVKFNGEIVASDLRNKGVPFECNLRDLTRWCEATLYHSRFYEGYHPENVVRLIYGDRMRGVIEKNAIDSAFERVFGCKVGGGECVTYVTSKRVTFGDVSIERIRNGVDGNVLKMDKSCLVLRSQMEALRSLTYCVNLNWMAILVGSSGTGKSSIVKTLASLAGKTLKTLPVTSAMDTTDLIGGFEQIDYSRHLDEITREIEKLSMEIIGKSLSEGKSDFVVGIMEHWENYRRVSDLTQKSHKSMEEISKVYTQQINRLTDIIKLLKTHDNEIIINNLINKLETIYESIKIDFLQNAGGKFEWVDSVLIKCLREGCWLLIDNVNLCSSAVLDRLNSLLEPNGVLTVFERGVGIDGKLIDVKPHPDFRLFLTMDPKNGEISRAMRNRGIEIYLLEDNSNTYDELSMINLEGVPYSYAKLSVLTHELISGITIGDPPNINELIQLSTLLSHRFKYEIDKRETFIDTVMEVYYKTRSVYQFNCTNFREYIEEIYNKEFNDESEYKNHDLSIRTIDVSTRGCVEKIRQQSIYLEERFKSLNFNEEVCCLLIDYYSISSKEDLDLRHDYAKSLLESNRISDTKYINIIIEYLYKFLRVKKSIYNELPFDLNWMNNRLIIDRKKSSNLLNFALYASVYKLLRYINFSTKSTNVVIKNSDLCFESFKSGKNLTLIEYSYLVHEKKINDNFNNVIIENYLKMQQMYDSYISIILSSDVCINDFDVVDLLYCVFWRLKLFDCFLNDIKSSDVRLIINNIPVHYKWFYKSLIKISNIVKVSIPEDFTKCLNEINNKLDKQFSNVFKLSRSYQKSGMNPPPFTTEEELKIATQINDLYRLYNPYNQGNDPIKIFNIIKSNTEIINYLIDLKTTRNIIDVSINETQSINRYDLQLIPIIDSVLSIDVKKSITTLNNFINNPLIHPELSATIKLYISTKDNRLIHNIYYNYYDYLLNSSSIKPSKYLEIDSIELSQFSPKFTYLINKLSDEVITLGNYRDVSKQLQQLQLILWKNIYQLSDDDNTYIAIEIRNIKVVYNRFITDLATALQVSININDVINKLRNYKDNKVDKIIDWLITCKNIYDNLCELRIEAINDISILYRLIAGIKSMFYANIPIIDPLAKKTIKRTYCIEAKNMFRTILDCYDLLNKLLNSKHPYCTELKTYIKKLDDKHTELSKYVAYRPNDVQYEHLIDSVTHAFNTIITDDLLNNDGNLEICLSKVASFDNLIHSLSKYRNSYPDIIEPLLSSIVEYLYGFKLRISYMQLFRDKRKVDCRKIDALIDFPVLNDSIRSYESYINVLMREDTVGMLKVCIKESFNHIVAKSQSNDVLRSSDFDIFNNLIDSFINSYNKQEELIEKKKQEAESLYKIKVKCDDKSEEERAKEEISTLFPNYHLTDFIDFQQNIDITETKEVDDEEVAEITQIDLNDVIYLHTILLKNFVQSLWLNPKKGGIICDYVSPLIQKYETFKGILDKVIEGLTYEIDKKSIASLNVLVAIKRNYGDAERLGNKKLKPNAMDDFYKSPNVDEIKSCYHILEELKIKINELLNEWPEQPTLKTILTVIDRIYTFDITSPVSRFLTGFEILLSKCHEWEEVAHSGVSLSTHHQSITNQIIHWRKMELSKWKNLLNRVEDRCNDSLSKWWIHLYNIMHQFINSDSTNISVKELVETLQTFITKSNLGEYQMRLDLIYVFHCHAVVLPQSDGTKIFINVLWNVYTYFKQFVDVVKKRIKDIRSPVEKKLKDYVKIVRWKDVNYWSIKDTVEKSHKTLYKYMKENQENLEQPVLPCLQNITNDDKNVGIWDKKSDINYDINIEEYLIKELTFETKNKLSDSISQLQDTFKQTFTTNLSKNLDEFTTTVIETSSHLQKLEVDSTATKEKQKSQAKNILQQKHRALADLFKTLTKMGVSYKSGLVENKTRDPTVDFLFEPIDLVATFGHRNYGFDESKLITLWESSEKYYTRSLMRLDVLETALQNPSKDLGISNIERCKGFSFHLLALMQKQKSALIHSTRHYYLLRGYQKQLNLVCDAIDYVPMKIIDDCLDLMGKLAICVDQFRVVLNACPDDDSSFNTDTFIAIPELDSGLCDRIRYKNDELWSKVMNLFDTICNKSREVVLKLNRFKSDVPALDLSQNDRLIPINQLDIIDKTLRDIKTHLNDVRVIFGELQLNKSVEWLDTELDTIIKELNNKTFNKPIDIKHNIKAVSKIINKYNDYIKNTNSDDNNEEDIEDQLIKKHLVDDLINNVNNLDTKTLIESISSITNSIITTSNYNKNTLYALIKTLDQLSLIIRCNIDRLLSGYRSISKLSSILLNIFIELASKGFCIPPEFSDEFDKEGISKPSDGMGLGEGEGERDVSDQIESEDQLDDAQLAGEEKTNEDKDCKEEDKGIEMSEDFDSKLQDKEKKEDSDESDESDGDEQMGETEKGAEESNKETFGDEDNDDVDEGGDDKEEEKGEHGEKEGESELGAKDKDTNKNNEDNDDNSEKNKESSKKDINEMDEPEYDDEQIDPHHGKQPELPEPEPMDLPDDLQLDDGDINDDVPQDEDEENPFDVDKNKDKIPDDLNENNEENIEDKDNKDEEQHRDDNPDFSSDDDDIDTNQDETQDNKTEDAEDTNTNIDDNEINDTENHENEAPDQTESNENNIESMDVDHTDSTDKVQSNQTNNQKSSQPIDNLLQEDRPDQEGVGESQMEEAASGHAAQTSAQEELKSNRDNADVMKRKQKPGESDSKRTLGNVDEPVKKKLKTLDSTNSNSEENNTESEMYQHIQESDGKESEMQVLDVATKEQAEKQAKHDDDEDTENKEDELESSNLLEEEIKIDEEIIKEDVIKPDTINSDTNKDKVRKDQHPDGEALDDIKDINIEGDVIDTFTVPRNAESTHHTLINRYEPITRLTIDEINDIRVDVEKQLSTWIEAPTDKEAEDTWTKISAVTSSLAQDLSEQLRLVLEPSKASQLRGDFKSGRRINMRKVIPYIASQFRKDKIWMRRTKPSKREYQIVLAIDDSSSMADNHSKELAFESVALISKALSLLESGQLSVLSFGEKIEIIQKLSDTFTDRSGVKVLQKFKFDENKTYVGKLVDFVTEMLEQSQVQSNALNSKLLIMISDGRGVFSEGEGVVRQAIRRATLANIFMVFVIIDNPDNKNSVLDIRMPVFKDGKLHEIQSYMDVFPFSFYIILRDINSLPSVLSDALRQWFEIVSNLDK